MTWILLNRLTPDAPWAVSYTGTVRPDPMDPGQYRLFDVEDNTCGETFTILPKVAAVNRLTQHVQEIREMLGMVPLSEEELSTLVPVALYVLQNPATPLPLPPDSPPPAS